jgi:hypothetical protein
MLNLEIEQFIEQGFVKLENVFSRKAAQECTDILWQDLDCEPDNPVTWTKPVLRLGDYAQRPFREIANSHALLAAFNQLIGKGRWLPRYSLGTFPIRFPHPDLPNDDGWHIDTSFYLEGDKPEDFLTWRANVFSKGRALLMLFLFTEVSEKDAPTRVRVGSHLQIAKKLAPFGEKGLTLWELAQNNFAETAHLPEILATGAIGTVFLCHPFLVHAAQRNLGSLPRVIAQPPLLPATPIELNRINADYSPLELSIRKGIGL